MKNNIFLAMSIAIGIIYSQVLTYLGLSYWMILLLVPAFGYVQLYSTSRYNFRKSLSLQPIPEKGYEKRLADLEINRQQLENLGFVKFDEFYLQLSSDVVLYAYYHEKYPIEICDYHFGQVHCSDLITKFENEFTLTTSNSKNAGVFPKPPKVLIQGFPSQPIHELFKHHLQAGKFLTERDFQVEPLKLEMFRHWFLRDFMKSKKIFTGILSPIKSVYWVTIGKNNKHFKGIEEQVLAKTLQLS